MTGLRSDFFLELYLLAIKQVDEVRSQGKQDYWQQKSTVFPHEKKILPDSSSLYSPSFLPFFPYLSVGEVNSSTSNRRRREKRYSLLSAPRLNFPLRKKRSTVLYSSNRRSELAHFGAIRAITQSMFTRGDASKVRSSSAPVLCSTVGTYVSAYIWSILLLCYVQYVLLSKKYLFFFLPPPLFPFSRAFEFQWKRTYTVHISHKHLLS